MGSIKSRATTSETPEEVGNISIARKFIQELQVNLREKLNIHPEDKQREINSFKGSFKYKHVENTVKSNFAFGAEVKSYSVLLKNRFQKPIFEFKFAKNATYTSDGKYYSSKSKLGLETMVYGSYKQLNCFFSTVTFKRLISAPSSKTYAITGTPASAKLVSLAEFH